MTKPQDLAAARMALRAVFLVSDAPYEVSLQAEAEFEEAVRADERGKSVA